VFLVFHVGIETERVLCNTQPTPIDKHLDLSVKAHAV